MRGMHCGGGAVNGGGVGEGGWGGQMEGRCYRMRVLGTEEELEEENEWRKWKKWEEKLMRIL